MNLSEMRRFLGERNLQLTRSLGQNFLHDGNQLRRIVAAAEIHPGERVLEVGPGLGPLTGALLEAGARVLAVEKDARLVEVLRQRWPGTASTGDVPGPAAGPGPELVQADALAWLREPRRDWSEWKLVANLPYSVASPILVELAIGPGRPERMVATLQWEVVRRIAAGAGESDYGVLTLLLGLSYEVAGWFKIPRACFFPAPEVDSACVTLVRRKTPLLEEALGPRFRTVVKAAFSQRRKMVAKLLRLHWPPERVAAALAAGGVAETERAERIGLAQWVTVTRELGVPGGDGP
ncbi:MAG: 16S rRNA (adenine(1518)-N(6)/adenine(1519)-N(6))-dimethyltransferase RsmA [Verrucomicrobiota bacterium]